jgi:lipoate-protein ligase A
MAHGEFKTPGGKLIAVEFDVEGGRLRRVAVTGDFFLYPEDALELIVAALEGSPADLSAAEIADRVRSAIPPGAELLGTSPEAIATAVRRALASTEGNHDDR